MTGGCRALPAFTCLPPPHISNLPFRLFLLFTLFSTGGGLPLEGAAALLAARPQRHRPQEPRPDGGRERRGEHALGMLWSRCAALCNATLVVHAFLVDQRLFYRFHFFRWAAPRRWLATLLRLLCTLFQSKQLALPTSLLPCRSAAPRRWPTILPRLPA